MENPILKIDWSELRNQKSSLLAVIQYYENNKVPFIPEHLTGILHLIDAIQDYAVDELGVNEMHVYDFEQEDARDSETPEEYFARRNAQIIFEMHIEGTMLFDEESTEMPAEFVEKIINDRMHADIIKAIIRKNILDDVLENPNNFKRDENGNLTYDANMYDYGFAIVEYCRAKFDDGKTREVWLCGNCGSDCVEGTALIDPNNPAGNPELTAPEQPEGNYCFDCQKHVTLIKSQIPLRAEIVGYQVVSDDNNGEIHPHMDGSFCLYSLGQARAMLDDDNNGEESWKLLTIWTGDVEDPTIMFEGDPRK